MGDPDNQVEARLNEDLFQPPDLLWNLSAKIINHSMVLDGDGMCLRKHWHFTGNACTTKCKGHEKHSVKGQSPLFSLL